MKDRIRLTRDSKTFKILKCLILGGGILVVATASPFTGDRIIKDLVREYFRKKRFVKDRFLRDLKRLQERKLINYKELTNGDIHIILTRKRGKKYEMIFNYDNLKLDKSKKWDGKWRLVIFDIPHAKKRAREAFRIKLQQLGFYSLQKSVFIIPYECEKEIEFVCEALDIRRYVLMLYVSSFEGEEKFRYHFF